MQTDLPFGSIPNSEPARCRFQPGNLVRVSYREGHVGRVLAFNDPRAWVDTVAFLNSTPTQETVNEELKKEPVSGKHIPVRWNFGRVYWEPAEALIGEFGADNLIQKGQRVELHPGCDLWMAGARYGTVLERRTEGYRVRLDAKARAATLPADRLRVIRF
jgi:hypothetical protein